MLSCYIPFCFSLLWRAILPLSPTRRPRPAPRAGIIRILNPESVAAHITDVIDIANGVSAKVSCGVTFPFTLGPGTSRMHVRTHAREWFCFSLA